MSSAGDAGLFVGVYLWQLEMAEWCGGDWWYMSLDINVCRTFLD